MGFIAARYCGTKDLQGLKAWPNPSFLWKNNPLGVIQSRGPNTSSQVQCSVSVEWTSLWPSPVGKAFFSFKEFWNFLESLNPHDYVTLNTLLCCLGVGRSLTSAWRSCKTVLGCDTLDLDHPAFDSGQHHLLQMKAKEILWYAAISLPLEEISSWPLFRADRLMSWNIAI